jgi:hypothetical protein
VDWIRQEGRQLAKEAGTPERFDEALDRFRTIDREVFAELEEKERSWFGA